MSSVPVKLQSIQDHHVKMVCLPTSSSQYVYIFPHSISQGHLGVQLLQQLPSAYWNVCQVWGWVCMTLYIWLSVFNFKWIKGDISNVITASALPLAAILLSYPSFKKLLESGSLPQKLMTKLNICDMWITAQLQLHFPSSFFNILIRRLQ